MPPPPRGNPRTKLLTAGALFAFAACTFSLPAILATNASASLYASDDPISSAATRRGAFMNAGSKDVGSTTIAGGGDSRREHGHVLEDDGQRGEQGEEDAIGDSICRRRAEEDVTLLYHSSGDASHLIDRKQPTLHHSR